MFGGAGAPVPIRTTSGQLADNGVDKVLAVMGYDLRNDGGSTATFNLRGGSDATAASPIRIPISVSAGESTSDWWPGGKIFTKGQIYFEAVANCGSLVGTIWVA